MPCQTCWSPSRTECLTSASSLSRTTPRHTLKPQQMIFSRSTSASRALVSVCMYVCMYAIFVLTILMFRAGYEYLCGLYGRRLLKFGIQEQAHTYMLVLATTSMRDCGSSNGRVCCSVEIRNTFFRGDNNSCD